MLVNALAKGCITPWTLSSTLDSQGVMPGCCQGNYPTRNARMQPLNNGLEVVEFMICYQKLFDLISMSYPKIIIDDFNIDMFDENSTKAKKDLPKFIDHYLVELHTKQFAMVMTHGAINPVCNTFYLQNGPHFLTLEGLLSCGDMVKLL
jgi:hypothetical protein